MSPDPRPHRIQRQRTKGWKMPANTVYVGRPTIHGNPYRVGVNGSVDACLRLYRAGLQCQRAYRRLVRETLRGKHLACWCPLDQPCHADILLEIANAE